MLSTTPAAPAFGQADLSNCEREQIHLAAAIQPHGALLVVREPDQVIVQASANARTFLHLDGDVVGCSLDQIEGDLAACVRPLLRDPMQAIPMAVRCRIGRPVAEYDALMHRPAEGGLVVELERAGPIVDLTRHVEGALRSILVSTSLQALCDDTARIFKDLTGYDRVMVYRFDEDGHGQVFSEKCEAHLEPYLGNRYPASDIPQMARRLYVRNRVRVLGDVQSTQVPLEPRLSPLTGNEFDMSLCFLRSMSPIHVQYLRNMGVAATLVASLVVGGKLWGLVACHHYEPRFMHYETRAVCELLAEAVATRIAAQESFAQAQAELGVRRLEQRMIDAISRDGDWRSALFDSAQSLLQPLNATGAALLFEGQVLTAGEVPGTQALRDLGAWLDTQPRVSVLATPSLGNDVPQFASHTAVASGLVATPVSRSPGEYLLWFRPEQVRTVTWGGDPFKPMVVGDDPADLSPRRSFAQWHQLVEGTSEPWSGNELTAARLIGESVADVVLQFRSVRLLIAQDQLENVKLQVSDSEQPVAIADPGGRVLLTNESLQAMLGATGQPLRELSDLLAFIADAAPAAERLRELLVHRRPWRGEVHLTDPAGEAMPLLVRADPVFSAHDRVLGYVVLFTDLRIRNEAETARRVFQESILDRHRDLTVRLDSKAGLTYRNVLSKVVDNAQLAALEITDGADVEHMSELLESVRGSVTRTAELLEHLIWHATRSAAKKPRKKL